MLVVAASFLNRKWFPSRMLLGFMMLCGVSSAVAEFIVRVLHSRHGIGIHDVVWRQQCGGRVHR
jgi:hypothetical protein